MEIKIDVDDLLKWARYLEEIPLKTRPAVARAINAVGDNTLNEMVRYLTEVTDLEPEAIRRGITVYHADAANLRWEMDASAVVPRGPEWGREWPTPGDHTYDADQLLKIVTMGDDVVCPVCIEAEENSPYTEEQINEMAMKWANFVPHYPVTGVRTNLIHPNCRCTTMPWRSNRRLPVQFKGPQTPPRLMTARQLAQAVADEMRVVIKSRGRI